MQQITVFKKFYQQQQSHPFSIIKQNILIWFLKSIQKEKDGILDSFWCLYFDLGNEKIARILIENRIRDQSAAKLMVAIILGTPIYTTVLYLN